MHTIFTGMQRMFTSGGDFPEWYETFVLFLPDVICGDTGNDPSLKVKSKMCTQIDGSLCDSLSCWV